MSSPAKRKGSAWERDVVECLRRRGFPEAERTRAGWQDDRGDIQGIPGVVLECKDQKAFDLSGWSNEAEIERMNASADYGIVVAKRRLNPAAAAYAILPLWQLARLLKEAGR